MSCGDVSVCVVSLPEVSSMAIAVSAALSPLSWVSGAPGRHERRSAKSILVTMPDRAAERHSRSAAARGIGARCADQAGPS